MRILFVGEANSVHNARWIHQLAGCGWDLHFFPTNMEDAVHPALQNVTVHPLFPDLTRPKVWREVSEVRWPLSFGRRRLRRELARQFGMDVDSRLARLIDRLRPNIVHSMGIYQGGYQVLEASRIRRVPTWAVGNIGCDIHYFARMPDHAPRIRDVLTACEHYTCECERDMLLARHHGFKGRAGPVVPQAGGLDLAFIQEIRKTIPPGMRNLILIKGYQHWYGRGLVALKALELVREDLAAHDIAIYGADSYGNDSQAVQWNTQVTATNIGRQIELLPRSTHEEMLRRHARAKVSVSLSVTDGVCMSFIEAMACGAFPVQSNTNCGTEWATHGQTALFVDPDDPQSVANALRSILRGEISVDDAARENWSVVRARLDALGIRDRVISWYESMR